MIGENEFVQEELNFWSTQPNFTDNIWVKKGFNKGILTFSKNTKVDSVNERMELFGVEDKKKYIGYYEFSSHK